MTLKRTLAIDVFDQVSFVSSLVPLSLSWIFANRKDSANSSTSTSLRTSRNSLSVSKGASWGKVGGNSEENLESNVLILNTT